MKRPRADSVLNLRIPFAVKLAIKKAARLAGIAGITKYMLAAAGEKMARDEGTMNQNKTHEN